MRAKDYFHKEIDWNRCSGLVAPGCKNFAQYKRGSQCRSCAQKKCWAKQKQSNRERCQTYYWCNREAMRARRRKYYQEHRYEEILSATVRRIRRQAKNGSKQETWRNLGAKTAADKGDSRGLAFNGGSKDRPRRGKEADYPWPWAAPELHWGLRLTATGN